MAVAFDAVGPGATGATSASATSLTWSHTITGTQTVLLAAIALDAGSDAGFATTATYNSAAMTSLGVVHSGNITAGYLQVFGIVAPAGTANVVVTATGGTPANLTGGSLSFTGAGQTVGTAFGTPATANTPTVTTTATAALASNTSGNLIAGFAAAGQPFSSATAPSTSRFLAGGSGTGAASAAAGATSPATGSSVTMAWTLASADDFAELLVEVRPFSGGGQFELVPQQTSRLTARKRKTTQWQQFNLQSPDVAVTVQPVTAAAAFPAARVISQFPYITGLAGGGTGYFVDQNGNPRFLLADNPWALIANAGRWGGTWQTDIDTYCDNRGGQGFTAIYLAPLGNLENNGVFADGRTQDGVFPFTVNGTPASSAAVSGSDVIALNSTFWARVDYFLAACLRNQMTAMLNVIYEGPGDFAAGGAYATMTTTHFGQYGAGLAARYAATANIIWVVGNDYFGGTGGTIGSGGGTPAGDDAKMSALLTALRSGGDTHVITIHNFPESNSREDLGSGTAGTVLQWGNNNASFSGNYSYNCPYLGIEAGYTEPSPIPVMQLDGYFYQGSSTYSATYDRAFRQDAWWAISSGARGVSQGSESIWQWPSTALASSGTDWFHVHNAAAIRTLIESLTNWHLLLPDTSSVLVTAGRGTRHAAFTSGGGGGQYEAAFTDSFVSASRTAAGDLAVIYLSHGTTITIDETKMVSGYQAFWADPVTGTKTGTATGTTYNSTAKGSNSQGDPDWVLILAAPVTAATRRAPGPRRPVMRRSRARRARFPG